ncbi:MAG: YbjP/YqhG family protein [Acidobacteriota bacterium]|nr:YbjP/YqhG family protein [Acidobacteriota bacterium]
MKILILALSAAFAICFTGNSASAQTAQTPEAVVRDFYNWYIHSISHNISSKKDKTTMKKYVTASVIQEIPRFESKNEADYFMQSQEWGDDWENKFTVSKAIVKGATATTIVTFPEGYPRVKVTLLKEAGAWKIDKVQNAPTK